MPNKTGAFAALQVPIIDRNTGQMSYTWMKQFQVWQQLLAMGFDPSGDLTANISQSAVIVGRTEIGILFQNIDNSGIVQSAGMVAATDTEQGAVILPVGAISNTLGTAAIEPTSAFDPAGSAAAAQTAAETHADTVSASAAAAAQAAAQAYASNASNLSSGTIDVTLMPGISVVVTTAKLTIGGVQGSMTFTNGVLTAQVQAS